MADNKGFEGLLEQATHELAARSLADGQANVAQLVAAVMLEANPADLRAWHLLALALRDAEASTLTQQAFASLSRAYGQVGDLPMALVTVLESGGTAEEQVALLEDLAQRYAHTGAALEDHWKPGPPPVPQQVGVDLPAATDRALVEQSVQVALQAAEKALEKNRQQPRRFFPLFSSLSPEPFVRLARQLVLQRTPAGAVIIEQGDEGDSFYVIAQGEVRVERHQHDDAEAQLLARLGPGAFFGEMAMVSRAPRAARVEAATDVTLLRADMQLLKKEMARTPEIGQVLQAFCRARMLENVLWASPVLRRVPESQRSVLLSRFVEETHRSGETLIKEGAESAGLFLMVSGQVDVSKSEGPDVLTLATLGPGDFVGEISLVLRRPAVATVTARTPTVTLRLPPDAFLEAIRDFPELLTQLYETALRREAETSSILAREAIAADDLILV